MRDAAIPLKLLLRQSLSDPQLRTVTTKSLDVRRGTLQKIMPGEHETSAIFQHFRDSTTIAGNHLYTASQRFMNYQRLGFIGVLRWE